MGSEYYSVGRVKDAHGLRGDIYIKLRSKRADWLESLEQLILSDYESPLNLKTYSIKEVKRVKDGLLFKLDEVTNRTEAEALKGKYMLLPTSILQTKDENDFYLFEITGFEVFNNGDSIGIVEGFGSNGAQDLLLVKGKYGEVSIPLVDEFIVKILFEEHKIQMSLPEGLIDNE